MICKNTSHTLAFKHYLRTTATRAAAPPPPNAALTVSGALSSNAWTARRPVHVSGAVATARNYLGHHPALRITAQPLSSASRTTAAAEKSATLFAIECVEAGCACGADSLFYASAAALSSGPPETALATSILQAEESVSDRTSITISHAATTPKTACVQLASATPLATASLLPCRFFTTLQSSNATTSSYSQAFNKAVVTATSPKLLWKRAATSEVNCRGGVAAPSVAAGWSWRPGVTTYLGAARGIFFTASLKAPALCVRSSSALPAATVEFVPNNEGIGVPACVRDFPALAAEGVERVPHTAWLKASGCVEYYSAPRAADVRGIAHTALIDAPASARDFSVLPATSVETAAAATTASPGVCSSPAEAARARFTAAAATSASVRKAAAPAGVRFSTFRKETTAERDSPFAAATTTRHAQDPDVVPSSQVAANTPEARTEVVGAVRRFTGEGFARNENKHFPSCGLTSSCSTLANTSRHGYFSFLYALVARVSTPCCSMIRSSGKSSRDSSNIMMRNCSRTLTYFKDMKSRIGDTLMSNSRKCINTATFKRRMKSSNGYLKSGSGCLRRRSSSSNSRKNNTVGWFSQIRGQHFRSGVNLTIRTLPMHSNPTSINLYNTTMACLTAPSHASANKMLAAVRVCSSSSHTISMRLPTTRCGNNSSSSNRSMRSRGSTLKSEDWVMFVADNCSSIPNNTAPRSNCKGRNSKSVDSNTNSRAICDHMSTTKSRNSRSCESRSKGKSITNNESSRNNKSTRSSEDSSKRVTIGSSKSSSICTGNNANGCKGGDACSACDGCSVHRRGLPSALSRVRVSSYAKTYDNLHSRGCSNCVCCYGSRCHSNLSFYRTGSHSSSCSARTCCSTTSSGNRIRGSNSSSRISPTSNITPSYSFMLGRTNSSSSGGGSSSGRPSSSGNSRPSSSGTRSSSSSSRSSSSSTRDSNSSTRGRSSSSRCSSSGIRRSGSRGARTSRGSISSSSNWRTSIFSFNVFDRCAPHCCGGCIADACFVCPGCNRSGSSSIGRRSSRRRQSIIRSHGMGGFFTVTGSSRDNSSSSCIVASMNSSSMGHGPLVESQRTASRMHTARYPALNILMCSTRHFTTSGDYATEGASVQDRECTAATEAAAEAATEATREAATEATREAATEAATEATTEAATAAGTGRNLFDTTPFVEGIVEDPFQPLPHVPTRCIGCGAPFQSEEETRQGFITREKYEEFFSGRKKVHPKPRGTEVQQVPDGVEVLTIKSPRFRRRTRLLLCRRCYRIQMYKQADGDWETAANEQDKLLPSQSAATVIQTIVQNMENDSIVLKLVDICDLESSVVPELFQACRAKRLHVIWLVNRFDCLPRQAVKKDVKDWVRRMVRQIQNVHIDDTILISASTGEGLEELEKRLQLLLTTGAAAEGGIIGKSMYVVGRVNVGKSTFINRFLKHINYKHLGTLFMKRASGGVTRSALPGTTLSFLPFGLPKGFKLIDTPGIPSTNQMTALLRSAADLYSVVPAKRLQPLTYALVEGRSLLVGAMLRVDMVKGTTALLTCYFSHKTTLHICKVKVYGGGNIAYDDVSIAGLGWISVGGAGVKVLHVYAPKSVRVFRRPAMLPQQLQRTGVDAFTGKSPRARGARTVMKKQQLLRELRDEERRRMHQQEQQMMHAGLIVTAHCESGEQANTLSREGGANDLAETLLAARTAAEAEFGQRIHIPENDTQSSHSFSHNNSTSSTCSTSTGSTSTTSSSSSSSSSTSSSSNTSSSSSIICEGSSSCGLVPEDAKKEIEMLLSSEGWLLHSDTQAPSHHTKQMNEQEEQRQQQQQQQ